MEIIKYFLSRPGDFDRIYAEIKNKLKASRITNAEDLRQMFLKYDSDRTGFISKENIKDLFRKVSLPLDDDIIDTVLELSNFMFFLYNLCFLKKFFIFEIDDERSWSK